MKANLNILKMAALCVLLAGCQNKHDEPISASSDGGATAEEVTVIEMEPDDQLFKAIDSFIYGNYQQSSVYIKEAAKSMREIATVVSKKHKYSIEKSAEGLEALAENVANNQVKDIAYLNHSFGKVGRVLAGYRLKLSENEYFNHTEAKSGALLKRTIEQLEKSITTHHRVLNPEEKAILNNGLEVATHLQKDEKISKDDLESALESIDSEITKWDKEFATL